MNPISRIAPVTDSEAAQMVHPDTLAYLAERLTSTPVETAAAEDAAGNATWQSPRRSWGWHAAGLVRHGPVSRRWPGWLAPVAAAAAVAGVIIASLAISGLILHHPAGTGPAGSSGVFAKVPRYFVAIPEVPGRAVVAGATATGAELGTIPPPEPHTFFAWVAAASDGRTFILGTSSLPRGPWDVTTPRPVKLYRLVLGRSGHPGHLARLPIPTETGITGLALSPDGSKLAVSFLPVPGQTGPRIQVFSLSTGAGREWVWPGRGTLGQIAMPVTSGGLQWEANNRTLMFQVTTRTKAGWPAQLYLLDTAAPSASLLASSTRIPVPGTYLGWQHNNVKHRIIGMPLITGDGRKLVAPFYHQKAPPKVFGFTITEFSVRTGQPIQVLYQRRTSTEAAATAVYWVNTDGTVMIAVRGPVVGVQTPTTFTPLPPRTQRLFTRQAPIPGSLSRLPAW
jgi:hypothetical protein